MKFTTTACCLMLVLWATSALALQSGATPTKSSRLQRELIALNRTDAGWRVALNRHGFVSSLRGGAAKVQGAPVAAAKGFVARHRFLFGLRGLAFALTAGRVATRDDGRSTVYFGVTYRKLEIVDAQIVVSFDEARGIVGVESRMGPVGNLTLTPGIDSDRVREIIERRVASDQLKITEAPRLAVRSGVLAQLVYLAVVEPSSEGDKSADKRQPGVRHVVMIDANSGEEL